MQRAYGVVVLSWMLASSCVVTSSGQQVAGIVHTEPYVEVEPSNGGLVDPHPWSTSSDVRHGPMVLWSTPTRG